MGEFAVIFDMDGVIIDSHSVAYELLCEAANEYGCGVTVEEIKLWGSLSGRQFWTKVKANYGLAQDLSELIASFNQDKEIELYKKMKPIDGLVELLELLREHGVKTALATSAIKKRMHAVLELFGLHSYFDALVCDEEVTISKPDPQIFLAASRKLAVAPHHCIVIEDSENGKIAANRAGMMCVGFKGLPHVQENMDGCNLIVTNFKALRMEHLQRLL